MGFFISNPYLDKQISDIRKQIFLSMNGVIADKMTENGVLYKKNYGVELPRLKQIAAFYQPNHDLAQRLWHLKIRETMILAIYLQPVESFSRETLNTWFKDINTLELVELLCQNLLSKLPYGKSICIEFLEENDWKLLSSFVLGTRIYRSFDDNDAPKIIDKGIRRLSDTDFVLSNAIARCIGRLCRLSDTTRNYITARIGELEEESKSIRLLKKELEQEIEFLQGK